MSFELNKNIIGHHYHTVCEMQCEWGMVKHENELWMAYILHDQ